MAELNETPRGARIHIAFFGLRNAGTSTLVNAFTGQRIALVSEVAGTTTDPVSKAMEILPLGPCLVTDTAGLDDVGELGEMRVRRSLDVLATSDVAVWVEDPAVTGGEDTKRRFLAACAAHGVTVVEYRRGEEVAELRRRIAGLKLAERQTGLLDGLVKAGDRVLCVCPIDASAPKGRLILPQVETLRACLDLGATATVCQPADLPRLFAAGEARFDLVVTDSQAFREVAAAVGPEQPLTGFSILFARQKGDMAAYREGLDRLERLVDGDTVLVAEGCTHRRQCNDIGTVKIPAALRRLTGRELKFVFASGGDFDLQAASPALVVQCGGCMLTRREVLRRIALARAAGVAIVNYGLVLAKAAGVDVARCVGAGGVKKG